ncbi:hypothetical protein [Paenibacillus sp. UNC499MF]|uniref:hypothetical protein n=1 Tax=Paenibacillus sp. UNC499MF TaxID=1502751 RepID=UPI00089FC8AA|nr:hypothetical protein [Paenibacillus sp. UNC499MF]SEF44206.1 hypothetical protein SAMN02799616_00081 [Paenibacillus sp. UNC499MF]
MPAGNKAKMTLFLSLIFPLYAGSGLWAADVLAGTRAASPEGSLLGSFFLLFGILTAFPFYFISFFPLGKLLGALRSTQPVKALAYSAAAGLGGCWLLVRQYGGFPQGQQGMGPAAGVLVFAALGLLLAMTENYLEKKFAAEER